LVIPLFYSWQPKREILRLVPPTDKSRTTLEKRPDLLNICEPRMSAIGVREDFRGYSENTGFLYGSAGSELGTEICSNLGKAQVLFIPRSKRASTYETVTKDLTPASLGQESNISKSETRSISKSSSIRLFRIQVLNLVSTQLQKI
jgi:hypothetical protein